MRAAFASLMVFAAAASAVPEASAQQPNAKALAEARTRYEKGKQLYSEGAFDAALAELQRSYELAPSYKILYNIALVQRARNDFAGSLAAYEKYLSDGGKELAAARKAEVQKEIDNLRGLVAKADIKTSVPDAEISVDDSPVGKSPLSGLVLNPGSHRISATKEGRQAAVKVIKVAGGDAVTVELDLPDASAPQPTTTATAAPVPTETSSGTGTTTAPQPTSTGTGEPLPPPRERGPVWVGWAVTGALAVGAGVTGGLAMAKAGQHSDLRGKADTTAAQLDANRSDAKTLALVTDILVPCAVVAGAVTLYFSVRSLEPAKTGKKTQLQFGASPTVGPSGVSGAAGTVIGSF